MYAMTCAMPDVSFALSMVSRHQQNPGEGHWTALKNILNWQTDKDDSRLQSGWIFLLNEGAVTWKSLKQDTVADSTCKSEYIIACEASKEAIWIKNFIGDLGVVPTVQDPIEILLEEGHVLVKHIRSEDNPADLFTKALVKSRHDEHATRIGLKDNIKF
ncbi:hypothetical protein Tco_0177181 [Tanacetum coccineum]